MINNERNLTVAQFKGDKSMNECNAYKFDGSVGFGSYACDEDGQTCKIKNTK